MALDTAFGSAVDLWNIEAAGFGPASAVVFAIVRML
jgi:hypothetical protein